MKQKDGILGKDALATGRRIQELGSDPQSGSLLEDERLDSADRNWPGAGSAGEWDDEERAFRGHFDANYANAGARYEDYAPAYEYGRHLRSNERYQGRTWEDFEPEVRGDWEKRYPGNAWERFKAAVRHAWHGVITS